MSGWLGRLGSRMGPRPPRLRPRRTGLRRFVAAVLLGVGAVLALHLLRPPPAHGARVLVAARDLPAGHRLTAADLRMDRWPGAGLPRGATAVADRLVGRVVAGPLGRGQPVTDSGVLGAGLLAGQPPDLVAMAVQVSDPAAAGLARRGDHVDVLAGSGGGPVVDAAVVLAEPAPLSGGDSTWTSAESGGSGSESAVGTALVLGVRADQAQDLAQAQAAGALTVAVLPP